MNDQYDFSNAGRGAVACGKGKTRITIMLDEAVIEAARSLAETEGYGYQTVINNTLRHALLSKTGKSAGSAQLKKGITASDLKTLEKKLLDAVSEIQQMTEADVRP
ncbi:BrnA antitoxin family protein [Pseudomonas fluorescens]|uniref:BrnA antitoxin family protein n=1 Tax=Pseudomonas fluorescens TaxID=294 RepID=UPI0019130827|nr:BrnA antitoxin family protein [Pseudomonas fluorescens]